MKTTKQELLEKCSQLGLKVNKTSSIASLQAKLKEHEILTNSTTVIGRDSNHPVKFVYHLADIHIRYLERHGEYKEVFSRLVDYIKNDKNIHKSMENLQTIIYTTAMRVTTIVNGVVISVDIT